MADFNVQLAQPQAAGANPVAPVQRQVMRFENPWVGTALGLAEVFVKNKAETEKKEREAAEQATIGDFVRSQTAISDAVAQGTIPKSMAAAKARANYSQFAANYPGLIKQFEQANKSLFEFTDLAEAQSEATLQKDMRRQVLMDAQKEGIVVPVGASPELEDSIISTFQKSRQVQSQMEATIKRNAEIRAQAGEQRDAYLFQQKQSVIQGLTQLGAAHFENSQLFVMDAVKKAKAGNVEEATMDLQRHFSNIEGAITSMSASNPELGNAWRQLFSDIRKVGEEGISGKLSGDVLEQQVKNLRNKGILAATADPQVFGAYVASSMFQGNLPATFWDSNQAAKNTIALASQSVGGMGIPNIVGDSSVEKPTYEVVKNTLSLVRQGKAANPEQTKVQVSNVVNNILDQIGKGASIPADKLKDAATFLASPDYAYMVENKLVNKEIADKAGRVFEAVYESGVTRAIEGKLDESINFRSGNLNATYGELVNFRWNGAGVVIDRSQFDRKYKNQYESHDVDIFLQKMKPVNDAVNQLIKIGAHREGNTDYAKFWENNKHLILPSFYPDPEKLKVGQVVKGKDGKSYEYLGGNYNDIVGSYRVVKGPGNE